MPTVKLQFQISLVIFLREAASIPSLYVTQFSIYAEFGLHWEEGDYPHFSPVHFHDVMLAGHVGNICIMKIGKCQFLSELTVKVLSAPHHPKPHSLCLYIRVETESSGYIDYYSSSEESLECSP